MDHYKLVCKLFEYFFQKVTGYQNYIFKPTKGDLSLLDKFLDNLDTEYDGIQSLGTNFFFQYFTFSFSHQIEMKKRGGQQFGKAIMFNWIIGDKSYKRWKNKAPEFWFFYSDFLQKYKIVLKDIEPIVRVEENRVKQMKEIERRRFYNTDKGFMNCLLSGLRYSKNKECMFCNYKKKCKDAS